MSIGSNGGSHDTTADLLSRAESEIERLQDLVDRLNATAVKWELHARRSGRRMRELHRQRSAR